MLTVNAASGYGSGGIAGGYRYWRVRCDASPYYAAQWIVLAEVEYFTSAGQIAYGTLAALTIAGQLNNNASVTYKAYDGVTSAPHGSAASTGSVENGHWVLDLIL